MMPENLGLKLHVNWSYHEEHTTCGWGNSSVCVCMCVRVCGCLYVQYHGPFAQLAAQNFVVWNGQLEAGKTIFSLGRKFPLASLSRITRRLAQQYLVLGLKTPSTVLYCR